MWKRSWGKVVDKGVSRDSELWENLSQNIPRSRDQLSFQELSKSRKKLGNFAQVGWNLKDIHNVDCIWRSKSDFKPKATDGNRCDLYKPIRTFLVRSQLGGFWLGLRTYCLHKKSVTNPPIPMGQWGRVLHCLAQSHPGHCLCKQYQNVWGLPYPFLMSVCTALQDTPELEVNLTPGRNGMLITTCSDPHCLRKYLKNISIFG
jgi:hypothetical protein